MSNILEQLKREGSIALWHDYQLGHANDLSGNGNDGVLVNSPWFDRNGLNTTYLGNEAVQVAHSASINLTTLSIVAFMGGGRIQQYSNSPTLVNKQTVAGFSYTVRAFESTRKTVAVDHAGGTATFTGASNFDGLKCFGINLSTGVSTPMYCDGLLCDSAISAAPTINTASVDLFIGNRYVLDRGFGRAISSFILFNKLLSATEHAQVYGELMKTRRRILV